MTKHQPINRPVAITAMTFGRNFRTVPRRMEYAGTSYDFIDAGLRTIVRRGREIVEILTMSDGSRSFRLRSDNRGGSWTLLSIE